MVSIIIVTYKSDQYLFDCLRSIYSKKIQTSFEVIVIDNDSESKIGQELKKKFLRLTYIKNDKNTGYSGGNNLGAKHAKGEYLLFLNPDTLFENNVVDILVGFLKQHANAGMISPLHLDEKKKPYPLQGAQELTPKRAFFSLSFIQKLFPNNPIANEYWHKDWSRTKVREVAIVPGSACMMRKVLFEKVGKFDEQYFLFFEEHDLGNRVKALGFKNFMIPQARLIHSWGKSTEKSDKNIQKVFSTSRFYYFKKFYGFPKAVVTEAILRISKETIIIACIVFLSIFLLLYQLSKRMIFIGDVAWFYLSARDMILGTSFPLVGIPSSHPWIHQGAFWTYLLAPALWIGKFHPLAGGYIAVLIGILTILVLYLCTKRIFGISVALFTTAFYATSPLVIINARMPYHTAPIPLFVILYIYALYQWIRGNKYFFCAAIFFLIILYNFELATAILAIPFVLLFCYGIYKKTNWVTVLWQKKVLLFSFFAFCIPLLPMLLYDTSHGYGQTLKFIAWIGYRILVLFGYPPLHPEIVSGTFPQMLVFLGKSANMYYYLPNLWIALGLAAISLFGLCILIKKDKKYIPLGMSLFIPLGVIFLGRVASDAYLPMLFVQLAITGGVLFTALADMLKPYRWVVYGLFVVLLITNAISLVSYDFFAPIDATWVKKQQVSKIILQKAGGSDYTIKGSGGGSQFRSFTMPYEYLTWFAEKKPIDGAKTTIIVREDEKGISVYKK